VYPQEPLKFTVKDADVIAKLAACFEGMGEGKKGSDPAVWKAGATIRFMPAKGEPIRISVNFDYDTWSEGNGDWKVKGDLKKQLRDLAAKERKKASGS
jgi:hypothetical protein